MNCLINANFSLHLPATPKTEVIIKESKLKLMKGNSIINTARGKLIDEESLLISLKNKDNIYP